MAGLQGAVEAGAPVSRLHEQQSYDPADFPVPTGREEEWRFTPLRRLRGLHSDASLSGGKVTVEADEQPDQDKNVLEPLVAGAVRVTVTPES